MNTINQKGLINIASSHDCARTADRLDDAVRAGGMNVVARVDHAKAAAEVGMELRPTILLIFGNPRAGTPLMQQNQSAAIDFPQKALVWEDENGKVWISYNDPGYLANRHGIEDVDVLINKMRETLERFASDATASAR